MRGDAPVDSVSPSTLSFQIYNAACKILKADRWHRKSMISDYPPVIAELVEKEALRIYSMRRDKWLAGRQPRKQVQQEPVQPTKTWEDYV